MGKNSDIFSCGFIYPRTVTEKLLYQLWGQLENARFGQPPSTEVKSILRKTNLLSSTLELEQILTAQQKIADLHMRLYWTCKYPPSYVANFYFALTDFDNNTIKDIFQKIGVDLDKIQSIEFKKLVPSSDMWPKKLFTEQYCVVVTKK